MWVQLILRLKFNNSGMLHWIAEIFWVLDPAVIQELLAMYDCVLLVVYVCVHACILGHVSTLKAEEIPALQIVV